MPPQWQNQRIMPRSRRIIELAFASAPNVALGCPNRAGLTRHIKCFKGLCATIALSVNLFLDQWAVPLFEFCVFARRFLYAFHYVS